MDFWPVVVAFQLGALMDMHGVFHREDAGRILNRWPSR